MVNEETQLLTLRDNARNELLSIKTLEDGLTHLNKLKSIEVWVKAEKKDAELQNIVAEQKLRTQRVLGVLIAEGQKKGELRKQNENHHTSTAQEVVSIGISHKQSSAFKQIASIPEDKFEEFIEEKKAAVNNAVAELTTTGALKLAKSLNSRGTDLGTHIEVGQRMAFTREVKDLIKKINSLPKEYRAMVHEGIKL